MLTPDTPRERDLRLWLGYEAGCVYAALRHTGTLRRTRQLYWAAVVPNWDAQGYIQQATRSGAPLILCPCGFDEEAAQRLQAALARVVFNEELVSGVRRPLHQLGEALPC